MSPTDREPDGTRKPGHSWESLVERQIREAMEAGAFKDLPYQGVPLPPEDDALAGEWGLAYKMLKDAGSAPPWIQAAKEAREQIAAMEALLASARLARPSSRTRLRSETAAMVAAANDAIGRLNNEAPTDRQHRLLLDLDAVLGRLDDALRGG